MLNIYARIKLSTNKTTRRIFNRKFILRQKYSLIKRDRESVLVPVCVCGAGFMMCGL